MAQQIARSVLHMGGRLHLLDTRGLKTWLLMFLRRSMQETRCKPCATFGCPISMYGIPVDFVLIAFTSSQVASRVWCGKLRRKSQCSIDACKYPREDALVTQ